MPIYGLTDQPGRIHRMGKIHLGIKKKSNRGTEYPEKTDYFVVKPDDSTPERNVEAFRAVYGPRPKLLHVVLPSRDLDVVFSQYYRCYRSGIGQWCRGDRRTASRMIPRFVAELHIPDDVKYQIIGQAGFDHDQMIRSAIDAYRSFNAGKNPDTLPGKDISLTMYDVPCLGEGCNLYAAGKCKRMAFLQVCLWKVSGLGVWQIDTTSINSIRNINGSIEFFKIMLADKLTRVPMVLRLVPQETPSMDTGRKVLIYVLKLELDTEALPYNMLQLQQLADSQTGLLLPMPESEEDAVALAPDENTIPEDHFPEEAAAARESVKAERKETESAPSYETGEIKHTGEEALLDRMMLEMGWLEARRVAVHKSYVRSPETVMERIKGEYEAWIARQNPEPEKPEAKKTTKEPAKTALNAEITDKQTKGKKESPTITPKEVTEEEVDKEQFNLF